MSVVWMESLSNRSLKKGLLKTGNRSGSLSIVVRYLLLRGRICGLVTRKEELRFSDKLRKCFFNFEVIDEKQDRIEIYASKETADRLFPIVDEGKMYYISGGKVKKANTEFNSTGHDFEIIMEKDSEISPCKDRQIIVETPREYDVVPLASVDNAQHVNKCVDVIAIVEWIGDLEEVKNGVKRELKLKDESGTVEMILWSEQARNFDTKWLHQVVGIKGARHNTYDGVHKLSSSYLTRIEVNPDHENARALRARFLEH